MSGGGGDLIEAPLRAAAERCGGDERLWRHFVSGLSEPVRRGIFEAWGWQAHGGQREPPGEWTVWAIVAGRGFGKTRAGAEWVSARARAAPDARIALVGGNRDEVARVMVEGPSGLIAVARTGEEVDWRPSLGTVRFASGATAFLYSAGAAEGLRGPEHHFAWADELAKWPPAKAGQEAGKGDRAWDNLMMGLRLGVRPRAVVTTTPKPVPLLKRVLALGGTVTTGGASSDNPHLPAAFLDWATATYGGTRLGRQELDGELIEDVEGSLFPPEVLESARVTALAPGPAGAAGHDELVRVVVGVDPPASSGGTCGIVVCGRDRDEVLWVLADASAGGLRPDGWARAVSGAAATWGADRVVAERNQGGEMVEHVLRSADVMLPVKLVNASRGKCARAEPVAALFESGRARLAGRFPALERQLTGLLARGGYAGPGGSPDRADACVWAMTALMDRPSEPRIARI